MQSNFELKLSFFVVLFLAVIYVLYEIITIPAGGHPFGHGLGILGAVLMIMTEVLYSARKRLSLFKIGQVRHWLSFHIFTGIVGPALVLMHTGLEFRGLAGLTTLMMALVVGSGFVGRYIYTAVPRTLAGVEVDRRTLEAQLYQQQAALQEWSVGKSARVQMLLQGTNTAVLSQDLTIAEVLSHRLREWQEQQQIRRAIRQLEKEEKNKLGEMEKLLRQQQRLVRQIRSLQTVRKLMGLWHVAHVPLGMTLFASMIIHIVATIYYGALV